MTLAAQKIIITLKDKCAMDVTGMSLIEMLPIIALTKELIRRFSLLVSLWKGASPAFVGCLG